jgi:hypothetical protein
MNLPKDAVARAEAKLRSVIGPGDIGQDKHELARLIRIYAEDVASREEQVEPIEKHLRQVAADLGFPELPPAD